MKHFKFKTIIFLCISVHFLSFGQAQSKLALKARALIGKNDAVSKKINTLVAWDAVKYCAKQAGVISQSKSNKLISEDIINAGDAKVQSHTRIPKGYIIGFFDNGVLLHTMISTGNGKAVGVNNKKAIGVGVNGKWEEITLQQLQFNPKTSVFLLNGKKVLMVEKPGSQISNVYYYKNRPKKMINTQNNGVVEVTDEIQGIRNEKNIKYQNLAAAKWSKRHGYHPDIEFEKYKQQFPEFKNWQQYAAKANSMLTTIIGANGKPEYINKNYIIKRYHDTYFFVKSDLVMLVLDENNKPLTMQKVKSLQAFEKIFESQIKWDNYSGLKNAIKNAKLEFQQHKGDFKFKLWNEYAYYAQSLIDNIVEKSSFDSAIKTKRVMGDLLYFNTKTGVFIAANKNNYILTMLKPVNGIAHYNSFKATKPTKNNNYDSVTDVLNAGANEYESIDAVLGGEHLAWTKIEGTSAQQEYAKNKNDFPEIKSWEDYAELANTMRETKKVGAKTTFKNIRLKVQLYGNYAYLFDPVKKEMVILDKDRLPVTLQRIESIVDFNEFVKTKVKWDPYLDKKDPILNAKDEFNRYKSDFKFKLWQDYAYHAQDLIDNIVEKAKNDNNILAQRNWKGHLVYYNKSTDVFIAANQNNNIITMHKPIGLEGVAYYNYYSAKIPPTTVRLDRAALEKAWFEAQAAYAKIPEGVYTKPGENIIESNYDDSNTAIGAHTSEYDTVDPSLMRDVDQENHVAVDTQENPSLYTESIKSKPTTAWAKKGNLPGVRVASLAYRDHKKEFKNNISIVEYISLAHHFNTNTPNDAEIKQLQNGDKAIYHEFSNLLGVYDFEGLPKMFYKPLNRRAAFDELN
ncbi:hypothetical protein [Algibacter pacificus]|uniref:hypothetical protein n=1 Tax=Algibacter pacificus TaxID=2599389 RepID=UPI0011C88699|nr:hypothetical protein [Algibacter pacificus]